MAETKYGKYIFKDPKIQEMPQRRTTSVRGVGLHEDLVSDIGGFDFNFNFVGVLAPHVLADPPHKHDCDEFLFFIPAEPENAPDLGGEAEIALGEEWEKHTITTAAVICLPPGIQHAPIYMKRVDKPFYFGHMLMASRYSSSASPEEQMPRQD